MARGLSGEKWAQDELELLKDLYPDSHFSIDEIDELLPKRTKNAIRNKASKLGIKRPIIDVPIKYRLTPQIEKWKRGRK